MRKENEMKKGTKKEKQKIENARSMKFAFLTIVIINLSRNLLRVLKLRLIRLTSLLALPDFRY